MSKHTKSPIVYVIDPPQGCPHYTNLRNANFLVADGRAVWEGTRIKLANQDLSMVPSQTTYRTPTQAGYDEAVQAGTKVSRVNRTVRIRSARCIVVASISLYMEE